MNFPDIIIACYHCRCLRRQYYIIVSQSERCVLHTVDIEEEKQLALFVGVVILGVFFAVVGAGLTMYWIYRKTHPGAYRHNRLDDLQRLQSTSSTNGDVKKTLA